MAGTIRVLSPVGEPRSTSLGALPLPALAGRTVGFLDNRKANFARLVDTLGATLKARHGVARVVHRQKAHSAIGASPALLAEMVRSCDLVIAGSAD